MIVVDSSALIAILFDEPEKQAFETIVASDERCVMSAVNAHETATVLRVRHGPQSRRASLAIADGQRN
jgi:ribonuclease VapC